MVRALLSIIEKRPGATLTVIGLSVFAGAMVFTSITSPDDAAQLTDAERAAIDARLASYRRPGTTPSSASKAVRPSGVSIGMTSRQVLESSWGAPESRVSTTTARGTVEHWSYGPGGSLMFVNDRLEAIQTRR